MQMSRSLLPKPAAAPAHSNSVPGLVLCLGGSSASASDTSKALGGEAAWVLEAGKTTNRLPGTHSYLFLGKQPLVPSTWKGTSMVRRPAGLLEEWCPSGGWAVASAAGNRIEQPWLGDPRACTLTQPPPIFPSWVGSVRTDVHGCISLVVTASGLGHVL